MESAPEWVAGPVGIEPRRQRRCILVALSGLRPPTGAIALGRLIALALDAPLHGLFVWPSPIAPGDVPRMLSLDPDALSGMVLEVEVGDLAERLVRIAAERPVAFLVLPVEGEGADVCGLGREAQEALFASVSGVIVVRPGAGARPIRRILVPLDGTPSTAAALGPATELARTTGAEVDLLFVGLPCPHERAEPGEMAPPQYVDQPQHEWPAFSEEFVERFLGAIAHCPPDVPARFFLRAGDPATQILRAADDLQTDLVVLVWHGCFEGERARVFQRVLRGAGVPVLVLRCK
jgi:nucleotide-binding universal stress UspA family protein